SDVDVDVRRAAVDVLTEVVPEGFALALAAALGDAHSTVRVAAANGLRELVEVIQPTPSLRELLVAAVGPEVRAIALEGLRALGLGSREIFASALRDERAAVRVAAVHGLVSLDAADLIGAARSDSSREVRVAVAAGLGAVGLAAGVPAVAALAVDVDALVRAAA